MKTETRRRDREQNAKKSALAPIRLMSDQRSAADSQPFSWLLKPSLLKRPTGSLAHLLEHRQVEVLSESLRVAYEKIFEDPAIKKKQKKFRAEANKSPDKAIDRIYELATLAVLRFRQWQFLEHEPTGKKGKRSPDHLMLALEGPKVLVEVKTLHLAEKVAKYDARRRSLQLAIQRVLAGKGIQAEVEIFCSYKQLPRSPRDFGPHLPKLLAAIRNSLKRGRLHTSYKLPNDGRIDVNLKGQIEDVFDAHAPEKLKEIERVSQKIDTDLGSLRLDLQQGGDLRKVLGERIAAAVQKKDKQVGGSGLDYPAVVAVCMGHHDTSIREAVEGYRYELDRRGGPQELKAVKAILVISLFGLVELTRLFESVSKHPLTEALARPVYEQARKFPIAEVEACWIPIAPDFGVKPIGHVWDLLDMLGLRDEAPKDKQIFPVPIFPKMVEQKKLEPVPQPGLDL